MRTWSESVLKFTWEMMQDGDSLRSIQATLCCSKDAAIRAMSQAENRFKPKAPKPEQVVQYQKAVRPPAVYSNQNYLDKYENL